MSEIKPMSPENSKSQKNLDIPTSHNYSKSWSRTPKFILFQNMQTEENSMNSSSTAKSTNNLTKQQTHRRTGQCLPSATTQHSLVSALARNHPQRYQTRKHHDHQTQHHQTHRFWTQQLLSAAPTAHHLLWQSLLCSPRNALQTTLLSSKGGDVELWSCSLHHALRLPSLLS